MGNYRIFIIVIGLVVVVAFAPAWSGELRTDHSGTGMMDGGMMGGMMDRQGMKEMMQKMMGDILPPPVKHEDLPSPDSTGAKLLVRFCDQCHHFPSPAMHTAQQWPAIAGRMFRRMEMMSGMKGMMMSVDAPSAGEQQTIVAYLQANALKTISPDLLPSPKAPGALLFRERCSQCHPLPDPKLHTAAEWPKVVEKMKANMRAMNKKEITGSEQQEISDYLARSSRR